MARRCGAGVAVNVAGAVAPHFGHFDAHNQLGFGILREQRVIITDACLTIGAQAMGLFKVNKEQSHLAIATDVSHRQKHAVAVIAGKGEGVFIHDPHEALVAAFIGD